MTRKRKRPVAGATPRTGQTSLKPPSKNDAARIRRVGRKTQALRYCPAPAFIWPHAELIHSLGPGGLAHLLGDILAGQDPAARIAAYSLFAEQHRDAARLALCTPEGRA
jgi:hypothetical protein